LGVHTHPTHPPAYGPVRRNMNKYEQLQRKWSIVWCFYVIYFYVTIVLCLNILWLNAVSEITARQTQTSLHKHDVIKVCSIEYLTTQIESVLPTFKSWTVHRIIKYLTLGLWHSLWNIYHSTTAYFFDPPCTCGYAVWYTSGLAANVLFARD